jgi:hypothetical protein
VRGEITRQRIRRLDRLAHQRNQVGVGAHPGGLFDRAGLGQAGQQLDELVDRQHPGEQGAWHAHLGRLRTTGPPGDLQLGRVDVGARGRPAHRQRQCRRQDFRQRLVREVLVQAGQGVAFQQVQLAGLILAVHIGHRCVVAVIGDRGRLVADPPAAQVQPPAEVHVLVEHEETFVEPGEPGEDLGADEHRRPGREQHVARDKVILRPQLRERAAGVPLVAHTEPGEAGIDEVDGGAVPVQYLAGHRGHRRIGAQYRDRGAHPVPVRPGIVVQQREHRTARRPRTEVAAARETEIGAGVDDLRGRHGSPDLGDAAVTRAVVDADQFELLGRVVQFVPQRAQTGDGVLGAPVVHDDHRDARRCRHLRHVAPFLARPRRHAQLTPTADPPSRGDRADEYRPCRRRGPIGHPGRTDRRWPTASTNRIDNVGRSGQSARPDTCQACPIPVRRHRRGRVFTHRDQLVARSARPRPARPRSWAPRCACRSRSWRPAPPAVGRAPRRAPAAAAVR